MFDILDQLLLRGLAPRDNHRLIGRAIVRRAHGPAIICFLPWNTSYYMSFGLGLVDNRFAVCFELPPALICSEPDLSARAMRQLMSEAEAMVGEGQSEQLTIVGYSLGTYPATYLANRLSARLISIAPADRGDLMLWQSPAVDRVRERAIANGYTLADYTAALTGLHPIDNIAFLGSGSTFLFGTEDPFIPTPRSDALLAAVKARCTGIEVRHVEGGHIRTLLTGASYVRKLITASARIVPTRDAGKPTPETPAVPSNSAERRKSAA
jgi:pimeloyl-ACP methyl ester carboxylesterase